MDLFIRHSGIWDDISSDVGVQFSEPVSAKHYLVELCFTIRTLETQSALSLIKLLCVLIVTLWLVKGVYILSFGGMGLGAIVIGWSITNNVWREQLIKQSAQWIGFRFTWRQTYVWRKSIPSPDTRPIEVLKSCELFFSTLYLSVSFLHLRCLINLFRDKNILAHLEWRLAGTPIHPYISTPSTL